MCDVATGVRVHRARGKVCGAALACTLALGGCFGGDDTDGGGSGGEAGSGGSSGTAGNGGTGGLEGGSGGAGAIGGSAGSAAVGGAGGAGSTGGSSGVGGSGGDAGSGLDAGAGCAPCIGEPLHWGNDGGLVFFHELSTIDACNTYARVRTSAAEPPEPSIACERAMPCMGSGLHGIADILTALADPDVVQALALGMVLFGEDSRAFDGTVVRIQVGADIIEVGSPCQSAGCNPIPAGVNALADLLFAIDGEQLALEPCAGKFD